MRDDAERRQPHQPEGLNDVGEAHGDLAPLGGRALPDSASGQLDLLLLGIGGLFVGPLVFRLAREAKGHGVPEVMAQSTVSKSSVVPLVMPTAVLLPTNRLMLPAALSAAQIPAGASITVSTK